MRGASSIEKQSKLIFLPELKMPKLLIADFKFTTVHDCTGFLKGTYPNLITLYMPGCEKPYNLPKLNMPSIEFLDLIDPNIQDIS